MLLNLILKPQVFSIAEIDSLIEEAAPQEDHDPKDDALPSVIEPRVKLGDIWQLGEHRLICGDSLSEDVVDLLMNTEQATMIFTDPPYNVKIDGHVGGSGAIKHNEFAMASGEMSQDEFTSFLRQSFINLTRYAKDGSIHFICMDWRHMSEMMEAAEGVYDELKNLIIWAKDNGGMGTFLSLTP